MIVNIVAEVTTTISLTSVSEVSCTVNGVERDGGESMGDNVWEGVKEETIYVDSFHHGCGGISETHILTLRKHSETSFKYHVCCAKRCMEN